MKEGVFLYCVPSQKQIPDSENILLNLYLNAMDLIAKPDPSGLYIHIPFCQVKCRYCAFAVFPGLLKQIARYLEALNKEMLFYQNRAIDTIYFGGGTPSILSPENWNGIMKNIKSRFILQDNMEITIECNPENISSELVQSYCEEGVTRLSLGLQTSDEALLKKIGRTHSWINFLKAYSLCRNSKLSNLNVDLIFGLPGQTMENWKQTLKKVLDLRPEHLSMYPLDIENKSAFYFDGVQADQELQADMYEWTSEQTALAGYEHYEIFSYSLPDYQCRHNLKYWKNDPCIGIGVSAAGYDGNQSTQNTDRFWNYIETLESGKSPIINVESLGSTDRLREKMMLGLRMKEGLFFTEEMNSKFGPVLKKLITEGILQIARDNKETQRIVSSQKGWLLSNTIYRELLIGNEL